jgi:hypothetical protein
VRRVSTPNMPMANSRPERMMYEFVETTSGLL